MFKGNLSGFSLGEVFQSLAVNNHTGTLTIRAPDGATKLVFFENGEIKLVSHEAPVAPRIGEILVREGKLTPEQLVVALKAQRTGGTMLGKVLVDEGLVSEEDLLEALRNKVLEEIYDLFLWKKGEFEFELNHCPEEMFDALLRSVDLTISPNGVIMEGLRRLDEWGMIGSQIRTFHEIYATTGKNPLEEGSTEADVHALIDGKTTVADACNEFSGTRFECCKAIYDLLTTRAIRPLSLHELRNHAELAEEENELAKATNYWRYATELCPEEAQFYVRLGDVYTRFYQEEAANKAFLCAFRLQASKGDWIHAADLAERLPSSLRPGADDLQLLVRSFVEVKSVKKALWAGNLLAESLHEVNDPEKSSDLLCSLTRLDPDDLNLRINIATLVHKAGDTARATEYYEEIESALERQKKVKDQIKILRLILQLDPERADVRQKIAVLVVLCRKLERRRNRRLTVAGISLIFLIVCTVVPLVYELKAREAFVHAQRMEEISLSSGQFGRARQAYEGLITRYSWSFKTAEAKLALERISSIETNFVQKNEELANLRRWQHRQNELDTKRTFEKLLEDGRTAEKAGDFKTAHDLLSKAVAMGSTFTADREILLPVQLTSSPSGAQVVCGESDLGVTPLVFRHAPGVEASFRVSLRGCEDHVETLRLTEQSSLHFRLERKPSWEYVLRSNFRQSFHESSGLLIVPSRDGNIYAFDPEQQDVAWTRKVGRFGDRFSDLHVRGRKIYVSTVVGELASLDGRSGAPHWIRAVVRGPVLAAPITSEDGSHVAVASLHGEVAIVEEETGVTVGAFMTENEIVASPIFLGELLVVGSTDSHVYGYSTIRRSLAFVRELSDEVVVDPLGVPEGVIVPTRDGFLHLLSAGSGRLTWSTRVTEGAIHSLLPSAGGLYVASEASTLTRVDVTARKVGPSFSLGTNRLGGIAMASDRLYATQADGLLSVWDLKTCEKRWSWRADSPVSVPPVVTKDRIFVACNSGAIEILEILE